jgi:hypothetical protein
MKKQIVVLLGVGGVALAIAGIVFLPKLLKASSKIKELPSWIKLNNKYKVNAAYLKGKEGVPYYRILRDGSALLTIIDKDTTSGKIYLTIVYNYGSRTTGPTIQVLPTDLEEPKPEKMVPK